MKNLNEKSFQNLTFLSLKYFYYSSVMQNIKGQNRLNVSEKANSFSVVYI